MSDSQPQSALREWRTHFSHPVTLVVTGGVGVILALAGPFGTDDLLSLPGRVLYWLALVLATYSAGFLVSTLVRKAVHSMPLIPAVAIEALAIGAVICVLVMGVNALVFGWVPSPKDLPEFLGTVFGIAVIVTGALHVASRHVRPDAVAPQDTAPPAPPPILDRLPLDKRAALVALSVEDHYVRVRTLRGEELILMRLSDAVREIGATPGAQVHRSHWAAFDQVTSVRREGDRAILTMTTGAEVPVSRANVPRIKEAGLLPR
ncbi:LytTR family DNA-binding domain-containing protein [Pacificoceanicola onchidii]|uniref:LytTR family DNA-binding domain-containing protein n=1 Tax=Pacificoceanicola onchidii TaxID=2562685 RepID=UPI0010A392AC|nr:LytTR family DNA-binding domain-containing protein [Pacificoceanicola onchidii]